MTESIASFARVEQSVLKRLTPGISFMVLVLTAATLYVGLGGPVPATDRDIAELELRTSSSIGVLRQQVQDLQGFATGTQILVLQNDLLAKQREIEEVEIRAQADPNNADVRSLLRSLRDSERSLQHQINRLKEEGS